MPIYNLQRDLETMFHPYLNENVELCANKCKESVFVNDLRYIVIEKIYHALESFTPHETLLALLQKFELSVKDFNEKLCKRSFWNFLKENIVMQRATICIPEVKNERV